MRHITCPADCIWRRPSLKSPQKEVKWRKRSLVQFPRSLNATHSRHWFSVSVNEWPDWPQKGHQGHVASQTQLNPKSGVQTEGRLTANRTPQNVLQSFGSKEWLVSGKTAANAGDKILPIQAKHWRELTDEDIVFASHQRFATTFSRIQQNTHRKVFGVSQPRSHQSLRLGGDKSHSFPEGLGARRLSSRPPQTLIVSLHFTSCVLSFHEFSDSSSKA